MHTFTKLTSPINASILQNSNNEAKQLVDKLLMVIIYQTYGSTNIAAVSPHMVIKQHKRQQQ